MVAIFSSALSITTAKVDLESNIYSLINSLLILGSITFTTAPILFKAYIANTVSGVYGIQTDTTSPLFIPRLLNAIAALSIFLISSA